MRKVFITGVACLTIGACFGGCEGASPVDKMHHLLLGVMFMECKRDKGAFPDNIYTKDGKRLLSWRVALLNYGDSGDIALYKRFHLDEPWDSPHNLAVAQAVPEVYTDQHGWKVTPTLR